MVFVYVRTAKSQAVDALQFLLWSIDRFYANSGKFMIIYWKANFNDK